MLRKGSELIEPFQQNQWLGMVLITFALAGVAGAQTTCPPPDLQPLQQPPEIDAQGGVLSTTFVVKMQEHPCVPVFDGTKWTTQPMTLRTYFYPSAPGSSRLTWSTPGATLRVRRATTPTSGDGDALKILLVNQLPVPSIPDSQCDAACPSGSNCCPPPGQPCPSTCAKGCPQETFPECSATTPPISISTAPTSRRRRPRTMCCWSWRRPACPPVRRTIPALGASRPAASTSTPSTPSRRIRPKGPTGITPTSTARCRSSFSTAWAVRCSSKVPSTTG
jgi:hypothetical protein